MCWLLSFFHLYRQPREKGKKNEMTDPGDHPLISWDEASCGPELHKEIWAWVSKRKEDKRREAPAPNHPPPTQKSHNHSPLSLYIYKHTYISFLPSFSPYIFTHQAVARLLILLSDYETEDLKHAHDVQTNEELIDLMLEYATETLTVSIHRRRLAS